MKSPRIAARLVAMAALLVLLLGPTLVEAGPKWRLRRWSSRPPIDPTIRVSPSFRRAPAATSRSFQYSTRYGYASRTR